ncbi:energy-coupling factor ABC transporter ATP-binding protein [Microbacterium album]|uniref:ABC transporter ATP-binding protein n=1 Tax=Microbacterium album TaxID=2053191 RepID=A0A917MKA4_9MICO|nr:ABC transporter ATP-binding protein [Microbacterium album]GGH35000.1 ABC transporter ATP-binding protein [Microbacterium album]
MAERPDGHARGDGSIALERVSVAAGGARILDDVTVRLSQRRIGVIGANGSGKSTFARLLNGLVAPSSGRVTVHGIDVAADPRATRERVGFVFSDPDAQILMPTVAEDVALSLQRAGLSRAEIAERVRGELERHGLADRADQPAYSLSGGQKQLLALVSVLIRRPALVVADEPTTLLDLGNARRMAQLLLADPGAGGIDAQAVIVTHDLDLAARCDIVLRFSDGRLVEAGDPGSVIDAYRREFA